MKLPKHFGAGGGLMQQVQSAMARAQNLETELAAESFEIVKGPVKCTFSGVGEMQSIKIDPAAVDPDDLEMLEDLILSAVRDGHTRATELRNERVQEITAGMPNIPGLNL